MSDCEARAKGMDIEGLAEVLVEVRNKYISVNRSLKFTGPRHLWLCCTSKIPLNSSCN